MLTPLTFYDMAVPSFLSSVFGPGFPHVLEESVVPERKLAGTSGAPILF